MSLILLHECQREQYQISGVCMRSRSCWSSLSCLCKRYFAPYHPDDFFNLCLQYVSPLCVSKPVCGLQLVYLVRFFQCFPGSMLELQFKPMDYVDMDYEDTEIWKTDLNIGRTYSELVCLDFKGSPSLLSAPPAQTHQYSSLHRCWGVGLCRRCRSDH